MRGIFGTIAAPRQRTTAGVGVPSYGMIPPLGSVQSATGLLVSQATAMGVSTVWSCVRRRAIDVARCPPSLYRNNPDGTREPVDDHPVMDLFRRPNRVQTWLEFMEQMNVAYLLRGNAYAVILRDGRGNPKELIPVNPDAVMLLEAYDGSIFYNVNRIGLWQIAMLQDQPVAIPEEDMLHLRGLTFNALIAVSTIGLARDSIGLAMGQDQQAARWMGNGARPSGVLKTEKPLSEVAAKRLKAQWDEFTSGIQNAGRTAVLEEGVEWQALSLTSVDLEFMKARDFGVLEVCRWFAIPPHKVAVVDRAASMNIPQQDQDYLNSTIKQDLERWEAKLQRAFDLDKEDIFVRFDTEQLIEADVLTRRNAERLGILSGMITPNEARRKEHLSPKPGGDDLLIPANTAALGSEATGTAPDAAGRPPGTGGAGSHAVLPFPGVPTTGDQPHAQQTEAPAA